MQTPYNVTDIGIQLKVFVSMKKADWELFIRSFDETLLLLLELWSRDGTVNIFEV